MRKRFPLLLILATACAWQPVAATSVPSAADDAPTFSTIARLAAFEAILEVMREELLSSPDTGGRVVAVDRDFRSRFPGGLRDAIPTEDGWKRPFLFCSFEDTIVIVSGGPDGLVDEDKIADLARNSAGSPARARELPGDDLKGRKAPAIRSLPTVPDYCRYAHDRHGVGGVSLGSW